MSEAPEIAPHPETRVRPPVSAGVLTQVRKDETIIATAATAAITPTVTRTDRRSARATAPTSLVALLPSRRYRPASPRPAPPYDQPVPSVPTEPVAALLFDFDGTLYVGDLPVHAYARRVAERLDGAAGVGVVAGMRRFLEDRSVPGDPGTDLSAAQDGYQAVELLAVAAGADADLLSAAYRQSRHDLAASAFAVDAPDGLVDLLTGLHGQVRSVVVSNADPAGDGRGARRHRPGPPARRGDPRRRQTGLLATPDRAVRRPRRRCRPTARRRRPLVR